MSKKNITSKTIRQSNSVTYMVPVNVVKTQRNKSISKGFSEHSTYGVVERKLRLLAEADIQQIFKDVKVGERPERLGADMTEDELTVTVDVSAIVDKKHYEYADKAGDNLVDLRFSIKDDKYALNTVNVFQAAKREKGSKEMKLIFSQPFIDALCMARGWTSFIESDVVVKLQTNASLLIYEMLSRMNGASNPISITFREFKALLALEGKYEGKNGIRHFEEKVLNPAKEELDNKAPYSFTYSRYRSDDEWVFLLQPEHKLSNMPSEKKDQDLYRRFALAVDKEALAVLKNPSLYGFTDDEVKANREVFLQFETVSKKPLADFLYDRYSEARKKDNPKGWIITKLRAITREEVDEQ